MKSKGRIELVAHEYAWELLQARIDEANVTGKPMVERPHWFRDVETGRLYHDIYACIGWPSEIKNNELRQPGYAAIIGVIRPTDEVEHYNPIDANFMLLDETESMDVPTLLKRCVKMREMWGFGVHPHLLETWYGDPDRLLTTLALINERLILDGGEKQAILITPPDDFYTTKVFDQYVRSIQSLLVQDNIRLYFGGHTILKNRLKEFTRDDPAVMAAGGMVHSLINRTMWMDDARESIFTVEVD